MTKNCLFTLLYVFILAGFADAAELVAPQLPEPSKPSCFDNLEAYMKASVRDCPLTYGPFTIYGTLDGGFGYEQWGVPVGTNADKPNYAIQRNSGNTHWLWSPNGLSTSSLGIRLKQEIGANWELIGVEEIGFNPFTFRLINGPQSLADNNLNKLPYQSSNFDSARAGQWNNGQGFLGISNPIFGTLTFGRTTTLSNGALSAYDPVASVAFSQIGFSAAYGAFGVSPTSRIATALTYRLTYENLRIAVQAQVGGYDMGNAATGQYQGQVGFDYGKFSFDAIGGWAQNAVTLSSYSGAALPAGFDPNSIVRATVQNTGGFGLLARYQWEKFKFYGGYIYDRTTNPSETFLPNGMGTIASGIIVPPSAVTTNNFNMARGRDTLWTGFRYAILKNLDFASGVYWEFQNKYLPSPSFCTGSGTATSSSKCAGGRYSYSFLLDYLPLPRIDLYAGILFSNVYGGNASSFQHSSNIAPTVGIRLRF